MKKADKHKPDDEAQSKRFVEKAREIQADESNEGADRAFKKAVTKKPIPSSRRSSS